MRIKLLSMLLILTVFIGGCITLSIHPFYDNDDVVYDPALVGIWGDPDETRETWIFKKGDDNSYRLIVKQEGIIKPDENAKKARVEFIPGENPQIDGIFNAHMLKLNNKMYLDLYPEAPEPGNEFFKDHVIRAHSILKVEIEGKKLFLTPLDVDWLKSSLKSKKVKIKHEYRDKQVILTAPTEELQQFVIKHDREAFTEPMEAYRLK